MSLVVPFEEIFQSEQGLLAKADSWERVELGSVCSILNGFAFQSSKFNPEKGFPIIRIRDLSKGSTETYFDGDFPDQYIVDDGDLLIGMDGLFACYEWTGGKAGLNQRVCRITPNGNFLEHRFLLYGINGYLKAIEGATSSVTVGHLSSRDITRIPFPLPPLAEQKRIVEKLDAVLGKVDACRQRFERIPTILKRFRQSVLAAACSGKLTADWREEKGISTEPELFQLSELFKMRNGKSLTAKNRKEGEYLVYGGNGCMGTHEKYNVQGQIIIVGRVGAQCGNVHYAEGAIWVTDNAISLEAKMEINPEFFALFLTSLNLNTLSAGTGQPYVSQEILGPLETPTPSLEEQNEIVRRVNALFALADQLEARYQNAKTYVDKLTQSVLAKAFRGELVPTEAELAKLEGREYEPASVLLERIQAEREARPKTARKKATRKRAAKNRS